MNIQYPINKVYSIYAAQSPKVFIVKMSIASKEARESNYWLKLLDKSDYLNNYPNKLVLFNKSQSIVKLLTSIIKTSREKNK